MRINISLGATEDWLEYSSITIASILKNSNPEDEYHFYIICNNFSEDSKNLFLRLNKIRTAEYHFLLVNDADFDGAIHDWLGVSSSYRLKLSSLTDIDKVLYLDSDIILKADIAELYSYNIDDYYTAMIEDKCSKIMKTRIKLKPEETFFNAGVTLMNLKAFRENNLEEIIFDKLRKSTFYTDQDVINDVCRGKILSLPIKWNCVEPMIVFCTPYPNRRLEYIDSKHNPFLIHYSKKPWENLSENFAKEWIKYRDLITN